MLGSLKAFLRRLVGESVATAMIGGGFGVVSYAGISLALHTALNVVVSYVGGVPSDFFNVLMLCGMGEAISIIGSALLVRAAIASAGVAIGRRSTGGA